MTDNLNDLQTRIQQAKAETTAEIQAKKAADSAKRGGMDTGIRAVTDLIGTPIVCGAIGMGFDSWFSTKPVFFILLAVLGLITGFWNLSRLMNGNDSSVGFKRLQKKEKEGK